MTKESKKAIIIVAIIALATLILFSLHFIFGGAKFEGLGRIYMQRQSYMPIERLPADVDLTKFPGHSFKFATNLKDQGYLEFTLMVRFKDESGVKELIKKESKIKYALFLALQPLETQEIEGENKAKVTAATRAIIYSLIKEPIVYVNISKYILHKKSYK